MKFIFIIATGCLFVTAGAMSSDAFSLSPTDSLGAVSSDSGYLNLGTGTGDHAVSSLGTWLTGNKYSCASFGREGSGALWEITTKDQVLADNLTFWNKRTAGILGDNSLSTGCVTLASGSCSTAQFTSDRQKSIVEEVIEWRGINA